MTTDHRNDIRNMAAGIEMRKTAYPCLTGFRVIDLTQFLAGPMCTEILAALGADVIKVEAPNGDTCRWQPPFLTEEGLDWLPSGDHDSGPPFGLAYAKRNLDKRSVAIDLKSKRGVEVLSRMIRNADALIHNFRPGVAERLGIGQRAVRELSPDLVYCSINGFGRYSDGGAVDVVVQALSGLMGATGEEGGRPLRCAAPVADQSAALFAAVAVLAGLLGREKRRSREPQARTSEDATEGLQFEVSMLGALSALLWDEHPDVYEAMGAPRRRGNGTGRIVPFDTYQTADGKHVAIAAVGLGEWRRLAEATEIRSFVEREDWNDVAYRIRDRAEIDGLLRAWVGKQPRDQVLRRLQKGEVTTAPVYEIDDIIADTRFCETTLVKMGDEASFSDAIGLGSRREQQAFRARFPIVVDGRGLDEGHRHAPRFGSSTFDVLRHVCAYSSDEITALRLDGTI